MCTYSLYLYLTTLTVAVFKDLAGVPLLLGRSEALKVIGAVPLLERLVSAGIVDVDGEVVVSRGGDEVAAQVLGERDGGGLAQAVGPGQLEHHVGDGVAPGVGGGVGGDGAHGVAVEDLELNRRPQRAGVRGLRRLVEGRHLLEHGAHCRSVEALRVGRQLPPRDGARLAPPLVGTKAGGSDQGLPGHHFLLPSDLVEREHWGHEPEPLLFGSCVGPVCQNLGL